MPRAAWSLARPVLLYGGDEGELAVDVVDEERRAA